MEEDVRVPVYIILSACHSKYITLKGIKIIQVIPAHARIWSIFIFERGKKKKRKHLNNVTFILMWPRIYKKIEIFLLSKTHCCRADRHFYWAFNSYSFKNAVYSSFFIIIIVSVKSSSVSYIYIRPLYSASVNIFSYFR